MAAPETQVPGTRSPPHDPSAATAPNRGKRCRCGVLPGRKTALEHREDGATGKRTTAPAPNRGKCCRCGGGRMVAWVRMGNLPRSGLSRGSDGILALIVRHFHVAGLYTPIYEVSYNTYACSISDITVSEAAIGHPDMCSAYSRHAHGQATHAKHVPIFRTRGTLSNIRNPTEMQLKF